MHDTALLTLQALASDLRPSLITWTSGQIKAAIRSTGICHDHEDDFQLPTPGRDREKEDEMNVETVIESIDNFFGDTSRRAEETLDGLEEIASHVQTMIEALEEDLAEED